jgi:hypothetical protein
VLKQLRSTHKPLPIALPREPIPANRKRQEQAEPVFLDVGVAAVRKVGVKARRDRNRAKGVAIGDAEGVVIIVVRVEVDGVVRSAEKENGRDGAAVVIVVENAREGLGRGERGEVGEEKAGGDEVEARGAGRGWW